MTTREWAGSRRVGSTATPTGVVLVMSSPGERKRRRFPYAGDGPRLGGPTCARYSAGRAVLSPIGGRANAAGSGLVRSSGECVAQPVDQTDARAQRLVEQRAVRCGGVWPRGRRLLGRFHLLAELDEL